MKHFHRTCLCILLTFFAGLCCAQTPRVEFNLFTGIDGMTLGKVNCITQDANGYMWFSDQTRRCITRFDGYHLTSYRNEPGNPHSLGGTYPEVIYAEPSGVLWIGFYGTGLDRFDPGTGKFTHYRHNPNDPSSLGSDTVTAILRDHRGKLWIGSYGGLELLDERSGKFTHYSHKPGDPQSLSSNRIRALYEDRQGTLWVGTGMFLELTSPLDGGLNRFNRKTGTFRRYLNDPKDPQSLINNKVRAVYEDSRGTFWVGTAGDGLHTMNRATGKFDRHTHDPARPGKLSRPALSGSVDHITFIREDSLKTIWIGTMAGGLNRYDPASKTVTHYGKGTSPLQDFGDNTCWWAYTSRDGVIWMSTQQNNLYRINPSQITIPHTETGNAILSFAEEPATGGLWLGTDNGLYKLNKDRQIIRHYSHDMGDAASMSNNIVNVIYRDSKGRMWLGTENGLNLFDPLRETFKRFQHDPAKPAGIFSGSVNAIYESREGLFWIGGLGGLSLMDRDSGTFTHFRRNPKSSGNLVNDMVTGLTEDRSGNLWIARISGSGLNRLHYPTGRTTHYLPGHSVKSIYYDSRGTMWAGTELGLYRKTRNAKDFAVFRDPNSEIGSAYISSIIEDQYQNIWASSMAGIFRINAKRDHTLLYGRAFGVVPGFIFGARTSKGELLFGDAVGYHAFYPNRLNAQPKPLHILLTAFRIGDVPVLPANRKIMPTPVEQAKNIRLNFNQNNFSFEFAAIDYRNPAINQHLYLLEGYDKLWRKAGSDKSAYYFNVPPGEYIFRVRASGSDGIWAERSVNVRVTPPWWQSWWAYLLYFLLFMFGLYLFDRLQRSRLLKDEREKARLRELQQAREVEKAYHQLKATQAQLIHSEKMASLGELTAGIAHEIRNPLNFVNNFSELGKELLDEMTTELQNGNSQEALVLVPDIRDSLDKIHHHGTRADAIVNSMLLHSRNNPGVKEPTDINYLAEEYLILTFHGLKAKDKSFHATYKTDFDESIGKVNIIPQDVGRVLLNLLNNAFYAVSGNKKKMTATIPDDNDYVPVVTLTTRLITDPKDQSRRVEITVKDNGPGIPKNVVDKIFQPFFTTKPTGEGTGLGLSLSYDIIKAHGGELSVRSELGEGSEFVVSLPV